MKIQLPAPIKIIVGLGNPGDQYRYNRHNIGFRVLDALAEKYNAIWQLKNNMKIAMIDFGENKILLVKPQTFMNNSGSVIPSLLKQGVTPENMLVVHDELEKPFGTIAVKFDGSHKGHNGLRSIIAACGQNFARLRCGIGRPEHKEDVPRYVLANFTEGTDRVNAMIEQAVGVVDGLFS